MKVLKFFSVFLFFSFAIKIDALRCFSCSACKTVSQNQLVACKEEENFCSVKNLQNLN